MSTIVPLFIWLHVYGHLLLLFISIPYSNVKFLHLHWWVFYITCIRLTYSVSHKNNIISVHFQTYIQCEVIIIIYHCYSFPVHLLQNFIVPIKKLCYLRRCPRDSSLYFQTMGNWQYRIPGNNITINNIRRMSLQLVNFQIILSCDSTQAHNYINTGRAEF